MHEFRELYRRFFKLRLKPMYYAEKCQLPRRQNDSFMVMTEKMLSSEQQKILSVILRL